MVEIFITAGSLAFLLRKQDFVRAKLLRKTGRRHGMGDIKSRSMVVDRGLGICDELANIHAEVSGCSDGPAKQHAPDLVIVAVFPISGQGIWFQSVAGE